MNKTHEEFVFDLVKESGRAGIKTFAVNRYGLDNYITSADRALRRLQRRGLVKGAKKEGDKVKTWWTVENYDLLSTQGGRQ